MEVLVFFISKNGMHFGRKSPILQSSEDINLYTVAALMIFVLNTELN